MKESLRRFIPPELRDFWDAARRATDEVNLHVHAQGTAAHGKWVAISIESGRTDRTLYDSKQAAISHQFHEELCAYVSIPPGGVTVRGMANYLRFNRALYRNGARIRDPKQPLFHMPLRREDMPS